MWQGYSSMSVNQCRAVPYRAFKTGMSLRCFISHRVHRWDLQSCFRLVCLDTLLTATCEPLVVVVAWRDGDSTRCRPCSTRSAG